jgi:ABC-2 type transport system permease protein/lipopolysaccharide transport system permease protein
MKRNLFADYRDSLRFPEFWMYATWLGIVTKYRKSRLGMFWAIAPSALYTFGIGGFYGFLQHISPRTFAAHMGIGYVTFRFITVSLSEATSACSAHASFILDGRVRLTDYVLRVMAKALFYFVCALPVLAVATVISPHFHPEGLVAAIPGLVMVLLNVAWMGVILAIIGARLTDVHELIGSILMFSFLFTPIIWKASQMPAGTVRGTVARINPLFHMVEAVRAPILGELIEPSTYLYLIVMLAAGWLLTFLVYRRYARYVPLWV